jgi:hypothetical protein
LGIYYIKIYGKGLDEGLKVYNNGLKLLIEGDKND